MRKWPGSGRDIYHCPWLAHYMKSPRSIMLPTQVAMTPVPEHDHLAWRPWVEVATRPYQVTRVPRGTTTGLWKALATAGPTISA